MGQLGVFRDRGPQAHCSGFAVSGNPPLWGAELRAAGYEERTGIKLCSYLEAKIFTFLSGNLDFAGRSHIAGAYRTTGIPGRLLCFGF